MQELHTGYIHRGVRYLRRFGCDRNTYPSRLHDTIDHTWGGSLAQPVAISIQRFSVDFRESQPVNLRPVCDELAERLGLNTVLFSYAPRRATPVLLQALDKYRVSEAWQSISHSKRVSKAHVPGADNGIGMELH